MSTLQFKVINAGDQGRDLIEKLKYNFDLVASFADTATTALIKRIVSGNIAAIKLEDNKLFYTTDLEVEEPVWTDMSATWGDIVGDITKQEDLMKLLNSKVGTTTFSLLEDRVESVETSNSVILIDVADLKIRADENDGTITSIFDRLTVAEATLLKKITSNTIVEIRQVSADAPLQYTVDGQNWINITGSQFATAWGNIGGDIENQLDLKVKFTNINESLSELTSGLSLVSETLEALNGVVTGVSSDLLLHKEDLENPHQVTKSQIGLGEVDNTSDTNKPVSTLQKEYIDAGDKANANSLTEHTENIENPHKVTKQQLGLDKVDNTADADKPVSNAQKTYITNAVQGIVESEFEKHQSLWFGTLAEYQLIDTPDDNTLYVIK